MLEILRLNLELFSGHVTINKNRSAQEKNKNYCQDVEIYGWRKILEVLSWTLLNAWLQKTCKSFTKLWWNCVTLSKDTYPLSKDSVYFCTPGDVQFGHNFWPLLLPKQHKRIGRLLNVWLIFTLPAVTISLSTGKYRNSNRNRIRAHIPLCKTIKKKTKKLAGILVEKIICNRKTAARNEMLGECDFIMSLALLWFYSGWPLPQIMSQSGWPTLTWGCSAEERQKQTLDPRAPPLHSYVNKIRQIH